MGEELSRIQVDPAEWGAERLGTYGERSAGAMRDCFAAEHRVVTPMRVIIEGAVADPR